MSLLIFGLQSVFAQCISVKVQIKEKGIPVKNIQVSFDQDSSKGKTDSLGTCVFTCVIAKCNNVLIWISDDESAAWPVSFAFTDSVAMVLVDWEKVIQTSKDVVISGTMKTVERLKSPVLVEVYQASFFKQNTSPTLFESLQNINGVRPQINCSICNTGDIHINGLEGSNTMILIDGMPLVSGLASVYGFSGIPSSLIERVEIIKGPASGLYGSEAIGGVINIITKNKQKEKLKLDYSLSSFSEHSLDMIFHTKLSAKAEWMAAVSAFGFGNRIDKNNDYFTDVTLQKRISVFNKIRFERNKTEAASIVIRALTEDRFGGQLNWEKKHRGGTEVYGESIYTNRLEVLGRYRLPIKEKVQLGVSSVMHSQNSSYGSTAYVANQHNLFGQLIWQKKISNIDLLSGIAARYQYYDDNTVVTYRYNSNDSGNAPNINFQPGIFVQSEIKTSKKGLLLLGLRSDFHSIHGKIITPRLAYKHNFNPTQLIRLNAGSGFRVVNVFSEDHAAITGARQTVISSDLQPEKSWNGQLSYSGQFARRNSSLLQLEAVLFYNCFYNKIIADYTTDINKILYNNLNGYAINKGASLNMELMFEKRFKASVGATFMENNTISAGIKSRPLLAEKFTAVWSLNYQFKKIKTSIDYTGNLYSPMRLPLLGALDPRPSFSPWWSIQNIQIEKKTRGKASFYLSVKNLLNWTPFKQNKHFLIARSHDPFDKNVQFDGNGNPVQTSENPYALTFDPTYIYAPLQGRRVVLGVRLGF